MEQKMNITDAVAETLFITLCEKAKDATSVNPILGDTKASELISAVNYDFSLLGNPVMSHVGICLRSRTFDNVAKEFIIQHQNPVVILLGCGLDTRLERIGSEVRKAHFYQIDLPEVIALREQLLPPKPNETHIAASMFDVSWMQRIRTEQPNGKFIIIIEGVIMFFDENPLKELFANLAIYFPQSQLYFDSINKMASRNGKRHDVIKKMKASFKFGHDFPNFIEKWLPKNYRLVGIQYYWSHKEWKRVGILRYLLTRYLPALRKSATMLHYKIM